MNFETTGFGQFWNPMNWGSHIFPGKNKFETPTEIGTVFPTLNILRRNESMEEL